jgi:hypothetical protein
MFLVFLFRIFRRPKEEMNQIKNSILDDEKEKDQKNIKNLEV